MELENTKFKKDLEFLMDYQMNQMKNNFITSMEEYLENGQIRLSDCISIDRIEKQVAVSELSNGKIINIPVKQFSYAIQSGDVINVDLIYKEGEIQTVIIKNKNEEEKARRIELVKKKLEEIKKGKKENN